MNGVVTDKLRDQTFVNHAQTSESQQSNGQVNVLNFRGPTAIGAARASHYSTVATNWTYKGGVGWAPIEEIRLRGVYACSAACRTSASRSSRPTSTKA